MEPQVSLLSLQEPIGGPYPELRESFSLPATPYPLLLQPQMALLHHYMVMIESTGQCWNYSWLGKIEVLDPLC
jgi:hypothetical protein